MTQRFPKTPKSPVRNHQSDSQEPFFSRQGDEHTDQQNSPTFFTPQVQRKSVEAETDDPLEKEADRVADKVTGTKSPIAATADDNIQPKGAGLQARIQRKPGEGEDWKSYPIQIPPGTASKQEFHRYAELIIFHKVLNLEWQGTGTAEIYQHISQHIGRTILFKVPKSTLTQYGVAEKGNDAGDAEYKQLDKDSKDAINEETDKQYYQSTGIAPGTKIKPGEKGRAAVWNDLRNQLMQQRKTLNDLPLAIRTFLQSDQTFVPANYAKLSEIAALLSQFTAADFEDYQSKVNLETTDLDALKQSVAAYMAARQERRKAGEERESIKTKLFGLEELYKRYRQFKNRGSQPPSHDEFGVHDPYYDYFREAEEKEREGLMASLKAYGFKSLDDFGKYVDNYEAAFRKETIAIAGDHLQRYRHVLFQEEKKLADDAYVTRLFTEISQSGASKHYDEADSKGMQAVMALGTKEYVSDAQLERQMRLNEEAGAAHAAGNQVMQQLPSASPLMKEDSFRNEELSRVKNKGELKKLLQDYIDKKKESIDETWADINANPDRVYELDKLIATSIQVQGITDSSIYDLIIKDKIKDIGTTKILKAICFVVIGVALAVASFGTGIPALLAAGGSLALSAYAVKEEIEKYKLDVSAHDVELLTKEPSLTWVVLAIVGAGADAAALAAAFKAAGPIAKATAAFNESKDVVTLEKSLAQLAELDAKIKQNIIRAAKAEAAMQESVDKLLAIGRRLNDITSTVEALPRLTVIAYNAIKKGITSFEKFLLDLKLKKLLKDAKDLSPEELNILKEAFEKAGKATEEEIKAMDKLVRRADLTVENKQTAKEMMEEVGAKGKFNKASSYHGDSMHNMKDDLVQKIISSPDAIYETRNGERLIFLKDGDIVVMEATKSARGNVITAYGKSGIKGESGATALGGKAEDAGEAVTDLIITEGRIPAKKGFIPPATKIYP